MVAVLVAYFMNNRAADAPTEPVETAAEASTPDTAADTAAAPASDEPQAATAETGAETGAETAADTPADQPVEAATQSEPATAPEAPAADQAATVDTATAEVTAAPETTSAEPAGAATMAAPEFSSVRIEIDSVSIVAGLFVPGGMIDIMVDGVVVAQAQADGGGAFATTVTISASAEPRVMSLVGHSDGQTVASEQTIVIAPSLLTVATADASTQAAEVAAATQEAETEAAEVAQVAATEAGAEPSGTEVASAAEAAPTAEAETAEVSDQVAAQAGAETEQVVDTTPQVLIADADGVRVMETGNGPDAMANVAVETITYDSDGEVEVAGRATTGEGSVQAYVDNAPVSTAPISPAGDWKLDLTAVETGVYTLRIDELNTQGAVVSRVETPFKREEPAQVAAAMSADATGTDNGIAVRVVQPGNTLWAIAREKYGQGVMYVYVFDANRDQIRNPDLIYPGQVFVLPEVQQ